MSSSGMLRRVALLRTNIRIFLRRVPKLLVTANVLPISPIVLSLITEAIRSSDTSVLTRSTRHNIPEDDILHRHRRENVKSYRKLLFIKSELAPAGTLIEERR
jgi:hypothetical protein